MEEDNINSADPGLNETPKQGGFALPFPENIGGVIKSLYQKAKENKKLTKALRITLGCLISLFTILFILVFIIYLVPGLQEAAHGPKAKFTNDRELRNDKNYKKQTALLSKENQRLSKKYSSYTSGQSYIVINTTDNRFFLYRNKQLIRVGSCSTGSYKKLQTAGGQSWTFKTPRGKFTIQGKRTHPAWHRPDWSFIEEGSPVPPKDSPLRWEASVLGDYAMDLGDSYMIHGTIYTRFLGMPVTHGCVRLNDEDLEAVFNTLNIGSKVYIF
jgi:lipoprotein-anchoring transpeptidase ErfK/SrfK